MFIDDSIIISDSLIDYKRFIYYKRFKLKLFIFAKFENNSKAN